MFSFVLLCIVLVTNTVHGQDNLFALNIIHYNDFHARFVETSPLGGVCNATTDPCIGGFARLTTVVREALDREPDSLLLFAGDSFQGTIWYNLLRWNVTQDFMNMLPHDAHTLGNHEFDNGVEGVVPYLEHLEAPVVVANIIDDLEPSIQGLYQPSIIVQRNGTDIGIIGVITASTKNTANSGDLEFEDEVEAVRREAERLHEQGITIIVVLSHAGIDVDQEIALNGGPYIDVIVGGHTHTLLYNGEPPQTTSFSPEGPYPVVVRQEDDRPVVIVQAAAHTQYLGEIKLFFNESGYLMEWEGSPYFIGNDVVQAPDVIAKINEYLPLIEEQATMEVGTSLVHLSSDCECSECNLGSLMCDAFMHAAIEYARNDSAAWSAAHFCVVNQGNVRVDIEPGTITFEAMILASPFENTVEMFEMRGDHILEMLEYSVAGVPSAGARMLQYSGIKTVFDGSLPAYERVVEASVRCRECDVPRYEPLQTDQYYVVVSQNFLGNGGDGFDMVAENRLNVTPIDIDYVLLMNYIRLMSPVFIEQGNRIEITSPCSD